MAQMYLQSINDPAERRLWLAEQCQNRDYWLIDAHLQARVQSTFSEYWQQRLVSLVDNEAPTVLKFLTQNPFLLLSLHHSETEPLPYTHSEKLHRALELLELPLNTLDKKIISLSNGELRRTLIARAYMQAPPLLVLDDPCAGLDVRFRKMLISVLQIMAHEGQEILMAEPEPPNILSASNDHTSQEHLKLKSLFLTQSASQTQADPSSIKSIQQSKELPPAHPSEVAFLQDICIQFGETTVFKGLTWELRQGEHWLLTGANGAGKSSLLAMLSGDHPQIYRNTLRLLGRIPGQGFNIWEHKAQIGFCSPEQHHQWRSEKTLLMTVADGFRPPRETQWEPLNSQVREALQLVQTLEIPPQLPFDQAPYPWQRLSLAARALVAQHPLILLDEPDQGLDELHRNKLWSLIDLYAQNTLVLATHHANSLPKCLTHHAIMA